MKIELNNVDYIYNEGLPNEVYALKDINLEINSKEVIGLIGQTGSGKSTLVQLLNGLLIPTNGDVIIDGNNSKEKSKRKASRFKVGLVFQYPENQLFEETISKDIAFGPKNMGLKEDEIDLRVKEAMAKVGLDYETYKDVSPFEISGGQQRRVAVAGILSMNPKVLVLDELTAGLDPIGRDEIFKELMKIYEADDELTIVLVSHSMEDVAEYVDRVIVMNDGKVYSDKSTFDTFTSVDLDKIGLDVPQITKFMREYKKVNPDVDDKIYTVDKAIDELYKHLGGKMANITIGQYLPFDSFVHRLDPRVKIIGVFLYIITIFFVKDFLTYIPFVILLVALLTISKIPFKAILKSLKPLIFIIVLTGIINLVTTPGKELFSIWKITVTEEGVYRTAFTILRLVLIILSTSVLTYTTSPMELTYGLEKLFSPLKKFGFPAGELAMMISISLRFIPTLFDEANKIKMAQMARGADFESGNIIDRAVSMIPLLVPLFINALKRSSDLATAMEARLYRIGEERTKLNDISMDRTDWISLIGFSIFCLIIIVYYFI